MKLIHSIYCLLINVTIYFKISCAAFFSCRFVYYKLLVRSEVLSVSDSDGIYLLIFVIVLPPLGSKNNQELQRRLSVC